MEGNVTWTRLFFAVPPGWCDFFFFFFFPSRVRVGGEAIART